MQGSDQRTKAGRHTLATSPPSGACEARDAVERASKTVAENRQAYVLVNACSEDNMPLTVQALSEMLQTRSSVPATGGRG